MQDIAGWPFMILIVVLASALGGFAMAFGIAALESMDRLGTQAWPFADISVTARLAIATLFVALGGSIGTILEVAQPGPLDRSGVLSIASIALPPGLMWFFCAAFVPAARRRVIRRSR